jgi:hypothetical protein
MNLSNNILRDVFEVDPEGLLDHVLEILLLARINLLVLKLQPAREDLLFTFKLV